MAKIKVGGFGIKTRVQKWMGVKDYLAWPDVPYDAVRLRYWVPPSKGLINFGDELSRVVMTAMLARRGFSPFDQAPAEKSLLVIGSILHTASEGSVVWGSGANVHEGHERDYDFTTLDVRAVRGPRTAEFLRKRGIRVPDVFGDPAVLLPELFAGRFAASGEFPVGIVPNWADRTRFEGCGYPVIDPMRAWNLCIEDILKCKFVLATSLHGLIIAESWGIPARYIRVSESEGTFKYHDYYEGTGRFDIRFARSIEEGLEMGGEVPPAFDRGPLMEAFPYDLWSKGRS